MPGRAGAFAGDVRGVEKVAFDALNPKRVFAWVRENGLYRSTDGGRTWFQLGKWEAPESLQSLEIYGNLIVIVTGRYDSKSLYLSRDGGNSWEKTDDGNEQPHEIYSAKISADGATLYAGGVRGLWESQSDAPLHWKQVLVTEGLVNDIAFRPGSSELYLATWKVTDGTGMVLRYRPDASDDGAAILATVKKFPVALALHPDPNADPGLFILLSTPVSHEVVAIRRDGTVTSLSNRPGWLRFVYTLRAVQQPDSHEIWLWLGHSDGLFCYECK